MGSRNQDQPPNLRQRLKSIIMALWFTSRFGATGLGYSQPSQSSSPFLLFPSDAQLLNTQVCPLFHPPPFLPIALPRVPHVGVVDAVLICLLIQEIEHVLDGQRERAAAVHGAEQRLKQVVHEFLQRTLMGAATEKGKGGTGTRSVKQRWQEGMPDGIASSARPRKMLPRIPQE